MVSLLWNNVCFPLIVIHKLKGSFFCCCSAVLMVVFVGCGFATYILWLVCRKCAQYAIPFSFFLLKVSFLAFFNHNNISVHRAHIQSFRYAHITKLKKLEAWVNKNECENAWIKRKKEKCKNRVKFSFRCGRILQLRLLCHGCMHRSSNSLSCIHEVIVFIFMGHYFPNRSELNYISLYPPLTIENWLFFGCCCWTTFLLVFFSSFQLSLFFALIQVLLIALSFTCERAATRWGFHLKYKSHELARAKMESK